MTQALIRCAALNRMTHLGMPESCKVAGSILEYNGRILPVVRFKHQSHLGNSFEIVSCSPVKGFTTKAVPSFSVWAVYNKRAFIIRPAQFSEIIFLLERYFR
jgi:hypothetical protein